MENVEAAISDCHCGTLGRTKTIPVGEITEIKT